ncbi:MULTISPECIES: hypothetical protein [Exiguobacterium]|uniref:hypothetical protein n=1 Tax=Exiguobacterium TaxID=33986 RepID=UPI001BE7D58E|nr:MULTISPECIES: hypothetical protein [Exiguobacterium]MCT4782040.1 hypothetical protein [Exiguobacterium himgiriensis]
MDIGGQNAVPINVHLLVGEAGEETEDGFFNLKNHMLLGMKPNVLFTTTRINKSLNGVTEPSV